MSPSAVTERSYSVKKAFVAQLWKERCTEITFRRMNVNDANGCKSGSIRVNQHSHESSYSLLRAHHCNTLWTAVAFDAEGAGVDETHLTFAM